MSSDNVPARGFSLAKGFAVDFEKDVFDTGTVAFTAKDPVRGQVIYLNGKEKLEVNSSSFIDHGLNIIASTSRSQMFLGKCPAGLTLQLIRTKFWNRYLQQAISFCLYQGKSTR